LIIRLWQESEGERKKEKKKFRELCCYLTGRGREKKAVGIMWKNASFDFLEKI
jgi:hypothetical protein